MVKIKKKKSLGIRDFHIPVVHHVAKMSWNEQLSLWYTTFLPRTARVQIKKDSFRLFLLFVGMFGVSFLISLFVLFVWPLLIYTYNRIAIPTIHVGSLVQSPFKTTKDVGVYDPYALVLQIDKGLKGSVIVDLRSAAEYKKEHIKYAINVPAYSNIQSMDSIVLDKAFVADVEEKAGERSVIVYGHFSGSSVAKEAAALLHAQGISAYTLGVGWNEWRHFKNLWVPEAAWDDTDINTYVSE